jgi:hypothetical protein
MVVDYQKAHSMVVLDSYPMPTKQQAFERLGEAAVPFPFLSGVNRLPPSIRHSDSTNSISYEWELAWAIRA